LNHIVTEINKAAGAVFDVFSTTKQANAGLQ
jgi:hypothetical protein